MNAIPISQNLCLKPKAHFQIAMHGDTSSLIC
jgi:hypothetical protein